MWLIASASRLAHSSPDSSNSTTPMSGILRFGYLVPDIAEAIIEGSQPRSMTIKQLLRGIPCGWADKRAAFGFVR